MESNLCRSYSYAGTVGALIIYIVPPYTSMSPELHTGSYRPASYWLKPSRRFYGVPGP